MFGFGLGLSNKGLGKSQILPLATPSYGPVQYQVQWNLSGTPVFRGHLHSGDKFWSQKNVHVIIIVVSVTSTEGTTLFRERDYFSGSQIPGLTSIQVIPACEIYLIIYTLSSCLK